RGRGRQGGLSSTGREAARRSVPQRAAEATETSLAAVELLHRLPQILRAKLGPHPVGEPQLRKGAFPEQEIGEPLFASGADQQVEVGGLGIVGGRLRDELGEAVEGLWSLGRTARGRAGDRLARGVVKRNPYMEAAALDRGTLGALDLAHEAR